MHKNIKLLLTCSVLIHGGVNLLAPIYALFIKEMGGTLLLASASVGFYAILRGVLYFLLKQLDETRFSKKFMIVGGYLIFAVSYGLYMTASKPIHIFGIQALLAFAEVVINPSWSSTIAISLTKGKERGLYSDFYGYRSIFEGLSALVGGYLAMRLGFNALFGLMTVFALAASVLGLFLENDI